MESSPVKDQRSTTVLRRQLRITWLTVNGSKIWLWKISYWFYKKPEYCHCSPGVNCKWQLFIATALLEISVQITQSVARNLSTMVASGKSLPFSKFSYLPYCEWQIHLHHPLKDCAHGEKKMPKQKWLNATEDNKYDCNVRTIIGKIQYNTIQDEAICSAM